MDSPDDAPASGRDRLVAAARRLFEARGYASTSIADVAAEAGMLKGNLAYYFPTKPALLDAVLRSRQAELQAALDDETAAGVPPRAAIERLLAHVEAQAQTLAVSGCPVGSLATELGKLDAQLHRPSAGLLLGLLGWLETQFARALPSPAASAAAEHLLALLQGAAVLAQARRDPAVVHRQLAVARDWLAATL